MTNVVRQQQPRTRKTTEQITVDKDIVISARERKPTLLKLQWLAERLRKVEKIKKQIEAGTYDVSSEQVARVMLNADILD